MMTRDQTDVEIEALFNGAVPLVFERMRSAGTLDRHWPRVRALFEHPEPLPAAVVQALMLVFSLRCSSHYCVVMHGLTLVGLGAEPIEISRLSRLFDMPEVVPDSARWSRVLRLAYLAHVDGPQQRAANFMLAKVCSPAECAQIERTFEVNRTINSFTVDPQLDLDTEPVVATLPPELQALVPDFVQFHMRAFPGDGQRPVSVVCSLCAKVRAVDEQWYPIEDVRPLLADDVLFSHGLCPRCVDDFE